MIISAVRSTAHHGTPVAFYVILPIVILVSLAMVVRPQLRWRMQRWQFRNPAALQPSATGLLMTRISSGLVVVVATVILIVTVTRS